MNITVLNTIISIVVAIAHVITSLQGNAALKPFLDQLMAALKNLVDAHKANPPAPAQLASLGVTPPAAPPAAV